MAGEFNQIGKILAEKKRDILALKNIKFTNGHKRALQIIKNAELELVKLKHQFNLLEKNS